LEAYRQPWPFLLDILEARSFARVYEAEDEASRTEGAKHPHGPMADFILQFAKEDYERLKESRARE